MTEIILTSAFNHITQKHLEDLRSSGLSDESILASECFSETEENMRNIFKMWGGEGALAFPYPGCNGFIRYKPDIPPTIENKPAKYLTPPDLGVRAYIPMFTRNALKKFYAPIFICEGEKKCLKMCQEGLPAIGLSGVWCFKDREHDLILDLANISWTLRVVVLVFDSDLSSNPEVRRALETLSAELARRGANIFVIPLPDKADGSKQGPDDFLLRHTVTELEQRISAMPSEYIKEEILRLRDSKIKDFKINQNVSKLVLPDIKKHGYFCKTDNDEFYYFYQPERKLYDVTDPRNTKVFGLVHRLYGLNPTENISKFVVAELITEASRNGRKTDIYQFAYYNPTANILYISRFDGTVHRLDGMVIQEVPNGHDGILFKDNEICQPYKLVDLFKDGYYLRRYLIDPINFATSSDVQLTPKEQKMVWQLYIYSLFFESLLKTKPILVFLGVKGSGKSSSLSWLLKTLFGANSDLTAITKDKPDSIRSSITNSYIIGLDNVDTSIPWLNDLLAAITTGAAISLRELFTTNVESRFKPRCFITMTARTPKFRRDDVVDRIILLLVQRLENKEPEHKLLSQIVAARNEIWTELIQDLNEIVKCLQKNSVVPPTQFRIADWAHVCWRIADSQGMGNEFNSILNKMTKQQSEFLFEEDSLLPALDLWLEEESNNGRSVTTGELYDDLQQCCIRQNLKWSYNNSISLGKRLQNVLTNLRLFYEVVDEGSKHANYHRYQFRRIK